MAGEAVGRPGVRVVVIRNPEVRGVDPRLVAVVLAYDLEQAGIHDLDLVIGGDDVVLVADDHRGRAELTFSDPAEIVLVEQRRLLDLRSDRNDVIGSAGDVRGSRVIARITVLAARRGLAQSAQSSGLPAVRRPASIGPT